MLSLKHHNCIFHFAFFSCAMVLSIQNISAQNVVGRNDTLLRPAVIFKGDTLEAKTLSEIFVYSYLRHSLSKAKWTRLRNAVYVTYPYARRASVVFNDINLHTADNPDKSFVRQYINSREKELKKEFTEPLTNLSVYQGKILMKLINRETKGVNCYNIVKELKGGFTARFWQTVAFVFGSNLKQPYDAKGEDAEIEYLVREVQRMYGYKG